MLQFPAPVFKPGCDCLSRLHLGCAQVSTSKNSHLCIFSLSVWLTSHSPSVSVTAPDVQGKLPWRPTTPTVVWASPSMPGSEVRKTMQPYRDGGRQRIVGVQPWPRLWHDIFKNTCSKPQFLSHEADSLYVITQKKRRKEKSFIPISATKIWTINAEYEHYLQQEQDEFVCEGQCGSLNKRHTADML